MVLLPENEGGYRILLRIFPEFCVLFFLSDSKTIFKMSSGNVEEMEPEIYEPITRGKEPSADFFDTTKLYSVQLKYLWKIEDLLSLITRNSHGIFTEEFASKDAKLVVWQLGLHMGLGTDPNVQLHLYHIDRGVDSYAISFKGKVSILNSNLEKIKLFPEGD